MSALAKYCLSCGLSVSGSDRDYSSSVEKLTRLGAKIYRGHSPKNVDGADVVVYTSAVKADNPELVAAKNNGATILKRSELLGYVLSRYGKSVAVSGSHGKTTASAMITAVLEECDKNPTAFIGGEYGDFGNFKKGESEYAVAEACEFKKNFLDIKPYIAVVLNIDDDHQDSFNGINDEIQTFFEFMKNSVALINADDENCKTLFNGATATFGIEKPAVYTARNLKEENGRYSFSFYAYGRKRGRVNLKIRGKHNIYDALAALACAESLGADFSSSKRALENFYGVKRRNEFIGELCGLSCYADYAHHPTEISALFNSYAKEEITVVFQPHTYSRTKYLFDKFLSVLSKSRHTVIYETYPAREEYDEQGSAYRLFRSLTEAKTDGEIFFAKDEKILKEILLSAIESGLRGKILFVGAGDIYDVALRLCKK